MFSFVRAVRFLPAAELQNPFRQSSATVGPLLHVIIACQEINFSTIIIILSQNFYHNFVLISENHPDFSCHQKNVNITVASWRVEYCHTGNFGFPALILKYLNLKNRLANFVQNCKIYSKEVLVNEISRIISSDKFSWFV